MKESSPPLNLWVINLELYKFLSTGSPAVLFLSLAFLFFYLPPKAFCLAERENSWKTERRERREVEEGRVLQKEEGVNGGCLGSDVCLEMCDTSSPFWAAWLLNYLCIKALRTLDFRLENADQAFMIPEALIKGWPCCIKWTVINSVNIIAVYVRRHLYRSALFGSCKVTLLRFPI